MLATQNALLGRYFEWKTALCNTCVSTVTMNFSKYYDELDCQAQKRYREKMDMACLSIDPYVSKSFVSIISGSTQELWPEIKYPDIFNYLICTTSSYTREQLKAYKSIDGYNVFIQGWVGKVEIMVQDEVVVLKANVQHSQSISSPLLHLRVAAKKNSTVICAHIVIVWQAWVKPVLILLLYFSVLKPIAEILLLNLVSVWSNCVTAHVQRYMWTLFKS